MHYVLNLLGCAVSVFGGFFFTLWLFRKVTGDVTFRPIINFWGIWDFNIWLESFRLPNLLFYLVLGALEAIIFSALYMLCDIHLTEGIIDILRFILDLSLHLSGWD